MQNLPLIERQRREGALNPTTKKATAHLRYGRTNL